MAVLKDSDIRILGVALRSTTGTMAFAEEIYDSNKGKFQSTINAELEEAISTAAGNVVNNIKIDGIADGEKVLSITDKKLSTTLKLDYNKVDGNGKIRLLGKGDTEISTIDVSDFIKDKFVQSAELVESAESGVEGIEVPYIKLTFNEEADPVRFSVKNLVDVYTGANVKLSDGYDSAQALNPAKGVSVDAAIKYLKNATDSNATRISAVEDGIGSAAPADRLNGQYVVLSNQYGSTASPAATPTPGASLDSVIRYFKEATDVLKSDVTNLQATASGAAADINGLKSDVTNLQNADSTFATQISNLRNADSTQAAQIFDLQAAATTFAANISSLQTAATQAASDITNLQSTAYKTVAGTVGQFVNLTFDNNSDTKIQTLSASVTTANVKTGGATDGLATAADVYSNCIMSTVVDETEYADFDDIVATTTTTTAPSGDPSV